MTDPETGAPIRVLVVDDSVVVRRVLARAVEAAPGFALAGTAADGRVALNKLPTTSPDVILLDLEMPVMDGFETMRELRSRGSDIPIVVFSHLTAPGAAATLEALALGATDFVLKPTSAQGIGLVEEYVTAEVLPLLRAIAEPRPRTSIPERAAAPSTARTSPVDAIVIAISTGGPNALAELVAGLPASLAVPILVVQHMPAAFTAQLAERLARVGTIPVIEASHGTQVRAGHLYIAPGGRHMTVVRAGRHVTIALNDDPPENSCRPAGDVLFRSAAAIYGGRLLAVVMTGMGRDGLRGAEAIRAAGGAVLAQDAATSVVAGMPGAVIEAGLVAGVIPLPDLAAELLRWTTRP